MKRKIEKNPKNNSFFIATKTKPIVLRWIRYSRFCLNSMLSCDNTFSRCTQFVATIAAFYYFHFSSRRFSGVSFRLNCACVRV